MLTRDALLDALTPQRLYSNSTGSVPQYQRFTLAGCIDGSAAGLAAAICAAFRPTSLPTARAGSLGATFPMAASAAQS